MLTGEPPEGHSRVGYWRQRWRRRRTSPPADARASQPSVRQLDAGPRWTHHAGYRSYTDRRRQLSRFMGDLGRDDDEDTPFVGADISEGKPRRIGLHVLKQALHQGLQT